MENADFARFFEELADLLELKGANAFKVRAMRNAVHTIEDLTESITTIVEEQGAKGLKELPGIGKGIQRRIMELIETGDTEDHQKLLEEVPRSLLEVTRITGVGPKKAWKFYQELGLETVDDLEAAAEAGDLRELSGMGKKSEEKILSGIADYRRRATGRIPLGKALPYAEAIVEHLSSLEGVIDCCQAGSIRRRKETIGDVDVLVSCEPGTSVMEHFLEYDGVDQVLGSGETKTSVVLRSGVQVDVRVVEKASFGAALHYFTGSKEHNIVIRQRAQKRDLRVNEYGVIRLEDEERIAGATEEEVFAAVDLPWIAPELRENRGEIEAAEAGELPQLITVDDLRGDLHMHTTATDGAHSIREMAEAAKDKGYEYIAITDHSQRVSMTGGLDDEALLEHHRRIREVDAEIDGITILCSVECDILLEGELDLEPETLEQCDLVIGSIHYNLNLSKEEMTERYLTALGTGLIDIVGHPTGRLLGKRSPFSLDMEQVLGCCLEHRVAMEINSHPDRLDLNDKYALRCKELGVPLAINTDAHQQAGLDLIRFGVYTARRGWLEPQDVLNTRSLKELRKWLEARQKIRSKA